MKRTETVHLVYFTGTGGTKRVADSLGQAFSRRGLKVQTTELNARPHEPVEADLLVLAYPVYACNAPTPVDEWVAAAPDGTGREAAVVSVSGGGEVTPNTACRADVIRRLERKGYRIAGEAMFVMPANLFIAYDDALCAMLLQAAPKKAEAFVSAVLSGNGDRMRPHPWDRVLAKLCTIEKMGDGFFGQKLKANDDCVSCGWCQAHCPRGNIKMRGGKPYFSNRCVICLRCVYGCPRRGIEPSIARFTILKDGFNLAAVEARTWDQTSFPPVEELTPGKARAGVRAYLLADETAPQA